VQQERRLLRHDRLGRREAVREGLAGMILVSHIGAGGGNDGEGKQYFLHGRIPQV
jgi:hypothetical protein